MLLLAQQHVQKCFMAVVGAQVAILGWSQHCTVLALAALVRQPLGGSALNTDEYPHCLVLSLVETTN